MSEIAVPTVGALTLDPTQTEWTEPQTAALAQLGIANAPRGDQLVFLHQAQKTGLDPFAKQLYMISRWDSQSGGHKFTIQAGIDGLRVIAERTGRYEGRTPIQWCGEDGVWRNVWLDAKRPPVAARCAVYKKGFREPLEGVAHYSEFVQTKKGGDPTHMWATKGVHMLGKVAEALALRAAFPQDLSGIYTPEEVGEEESTAAAGGPGQTIAESVAAEYSQPSGEPMVSSAQLSEIAGRLKDLGMGKDAALELYAEVAGREVPVTRLLTEKEADAVLEELVERAKPAAEPPETNEDGVVDAHIVEDEPASADEADALWPEVAQPGSAR
ncbi:hypothetical protein GCM10023224_05630 [Streptomonospora halophila]|uniref:Phage recombination protein Bet n=1 Tax=Streptomonospora halophila TaxID=427369 RepID=A0ABP9G571_9ACTN